MSEHASPGCRFRVRLSLAGRGRKRKTEDGKNLSLLATRFVPSNPPSSSSENSDFRSTCPREKSAIEYKKQQAKLKIATYHQLILRSHYSLTTDPLLDIDYIFSLSSGLFSVFSPYLSPAYVVSASTRSIRRQLRWDRTMSLSEPPPSCRRWWWSCSWVMGRARLLRLHRRVLPVTVRLICGWFSRLSLISYDERFNMSSPTTECRESDRSRSSLHSSSGGTGDHVSLPLTLALLHDLFIMRNLTLLYRFILFACLERFCT